jgi:hypothetical protein
MSHFLRVLPGASSVTVSFWRTWHRRIESLFVITASGLIACFRIRPRTAAGIQDVAW